MPLKEQATGWLLCIFVEALPVDVLLRLWDLFFLEGDAVLVCAAVGCLRLHQEALIPHAARTYLCDCSCGAQWSRVCTCARSWSPRWDH